MTTPDFLQQIREAKSDLHLVGMLLQIYPECEIAVIVAALTRAQELILLQKGMK